MWAGPTTGESAKFWMSVLSELRSRGIADVCIVLRPGDPEGVMQEMWALFAVYQAICRIVGMAVNAAGIPPDRISFPHALAAATDTIAAFPP